MPSFRSARSRCSGFSVVGGLVGPLPRAEPEGVAYHRGSAAGAVARRLGLLACSGSWSFSLKGRGPRAWGVAHRACKAPECCRLTP